MYKGSVIVCIDRCRIRLGHVTKCDMVPQNVTFVDNKTAL